MAKIWEENEVTMDNLIAHLRDSGQKPNTLHDDEAWFRTESGTGYCVSIMDDKKFVRISTYLPLDPAQSKEAKLQFEHRLNHDVFLPVFCLDDDGDLTVTYVMPFAHGLIAGQFVAILNRFADLLDYIVRKQNDDGIIDFGHDVIDTIIGSDDLSLDSPTVRKGLPH